MPPEFERNWDVGSPEEIRSAQLKRLRDYLRFQVLPFSPFYRRHFREAGIDPAEIRSFDQLAQLPLTDKSLIAPTEDDPARAREIVLQPTPEAIREHWPLSRLLKLKFEGLFRGSERVRQRLANEEYRPVSVFFTTGRTALPTAFCLTNYDLKVLEEVGKRIGQVAHIETADDKLMNLFPYAPHLAFWQVYYVGLGSAAFTLNTGGGKVMGTEAILRAIEKIRPAFLIGIPGYIYHALRQAKSDGMDLSFVKGLALGGDQVTPGYRERVKELLRAMGAENPRVQSVLGFTESRKCWAECGGEAAAGFHTYPDLEIFEVIDPESEKPVGPGETGELVYTNLVGRGSTVVRYRTGDLVIGGQTWEPCPYCGRTVPRLASQLERVSYHKSFQLSKLKGTLVNLAVLKEELDKDSNVEEWQLVIKKRNDDPHEVDELHLNLALSSDASDAAAVCEKIGRRLFEVTEVKMNSIEALPLEKVLELLGMESQLKEKRIVDLRPTDTAQVAR